MEISKHLRIAVRIGYAIIFLGILYAFLALISLSLEAAVFPFLAAVLMVVAMWLIHRQYSLAPRIIISLSPLLLNAGFHSLVATPDQPVVTALYFSQFGMALIPWVLFDYREKMALSVCTIVGIVILVGQQGLNFVVMDNEASADAFNGGYLEYLTYAFGVGLLFLVMYSFLQEFYDQTERESKLNQKLKRYQRKIVKHNRSLYRRQTKVTKINEMLEMEVKERAIILEEQNRILAEQSFINSHLLRAPLCRAMALVNLIESMEENKEIPEFLSLIHDALDEMNQLTIAISSNLEKRGYFEEYGDDFDQLKEAQHDHELKISSRA
ncbi:hypothetical protein N6H18_05000 [Reichenbachiella agarivorans]|uniref:Histidine kinase n=1 Tax=Reichenbachiella agarivorans TaxID=2979464 RepID=A0ABY6CS14_9BACT|nr:hypothetical protein [Reichenbachiella agarivorans]UXP33307.1 hypothetical protein N6H18_05000 [Reichenbachiella agarivorans]